MGTSGQVCETDVQIRYVQGVGVCRTDDFTIVLYMLLKLHAPVDPCRANHFVAFMVCHTIRKRVVVLVFYNVI